MSHTILLVQASSKPESRTYSDYESVNDCLEGKAEKNLFRLNRFFFQLINDKQLMKGVCKMYEEHLKRMNPNSPSITYDISHLFDFVDQLTDLSCLV